MMQQFYYVAIHCNFHTGLSGNGKATDFLVGAFTDSTFLNMNLPLASGELNN